jgi:hypothetical protein
MVELTEQDLIDCGMKQRQMLGTGWRSTSSMCDAVYYYEHGRIGINATYFWTWFVDGEMHNEIAVYSKDKLTELLNKHK